MSQFDDILSDFEDAAVGGDSRDARLTKQQLKDVVMEIVKKSLDTDDPYAYIEKEIGGL
jgi:hypothetical protein